MKDKLRKQIRVLGFLIMVTLLLGISGCSIQKRIPAFFKEQAEQVVTSEAETSEEKKEQISEEVSEEIPEEILVNTEVEDANSGSFSIEISGISQEENLQTVLVAVWSLDDQSDLVWYEAQREERGSYFVEGNILNYQYKQVTLQETIYRVNLDESQEGLASTVYEYIPLNLRNSTVLGITGCGDAKFIGDRIITSNENLMLFDLNGNQIQTYDTIQAKWMDAMQLGTGIAVVYGNMNREIRICRMDSSYRLESDIQILSSDSNLLIDPAFTATDTGYYITVTEVSGVVNSSNPENENGIYTIHLYYSENLTDWTWVSDVITEQRNLEDVEIRYYDGKIYVMYERELADRMVSSIHLIESSDGGYSWQENRELIPETGDNEPARFMKVEEGYVIYYSSDKESLGESYMGASIYAAYFDLNFQLISEKKIGIPYYEKGNLLYDLVITSDGKGRYLFSHNYLTDDQLIVSQ